jgi:hypothetical protein
MTTNASIDRLQKKIKAAIASQVQIESDKEEKSLTICPHYFGYLAGLPSDLSFPEECLLCPKVVDCIIYLHE